MLASRDAFRGSAVLAVALAIGCAGNRKTAERPDETSESEAQIEALKAELAAAEARVEALEAERAQSEARGAPADIARPFTEEGLTEQLWRHHRPEGLPPSFEPGPTAWAEAEVPSRFLQDEAQGFPSAGALATAVAGEVSSASLGVDVWEVKTRVLVADDRQSASAAILSWGMKDDAVQGEDLRLELRRGERGWYVESAARRSWCRRGVTGDQRCR